MPPATLRDKPAPKFTPPVTEIPEVNFQPPQPARLDLQEDPQGILSAEEQMFGKKASEVARPTSID